MGPLSIRGSHFSLKNFCLSKFFEKIRQFLRLLQKKPAIICATRKEAKKTKKDCGNLPDFRDLFRHMELSIPGGPDRPRQADGVPVVPRGRRAMLSTLRSANAKTPAMRNALGKAAG